LVNPLNLHFKSYGSGRPLIILHGLFGSQVNWASIGKRLGKQVRVYAVDLRNHGDSPHSSEFNYQVMAEDLSLFICTHNLSEATILGHSLGGKVAMAFASTHPDRVEKLIVVDIAPRSYSGDHKGMFEALLALDLGKISRLGDAVDALAPDIPDISARYFLTKNLVRDPDGRFRWKVNLKGIYQNYDQLGGVVMERPFEKPTIFFRGENSDFITEEDSKLIRQWYPKAEIETIEGAGHWIHIDAPEKLTQKVLDFVGR